MLPFRHRRKHFRDENWIIRIITEHGRFLRHLANLTSDKLAVRAEEYCNKLVCRLCPSEFDENLFEFQSRIQEHGFEFCSVSLLPESS